MVSLPLMNSLDVTEYGLYPGDRPADLGLHIHFRAGLTLILGANGLGKTTLVTMLYRLLTGPYDIAALMGGTDLGTASLRVSALRGRNRGVFAQRVADEAVQASARLTFELGTEEVVVERNLRDLSLRSFKVGDSAPSQDERKYQDEMVRLAGVSTFGDWILLLRYIVFFFEDRRSLVWDPSAQRQLLRILFLEPERGQHWTVREREILETDTRVRNMRAVVTGQERDLARDESLALDEQGVREELAQLEHDQQVANEALNEISSGLPDIEARHESTRLRYLTLEQQRESQYRELEEAHLHAISARLPRHSDSARYILAQLVTESRCLACGNEVPGFVEYMESRIRRNECVVCGSDVAALGDQAGAEVADERIRRDEQRLQQFDVELEAARNSLDVSEAERASAVTEIQLLQTAVAERAARMDFLLKQLPPEESQLHERQGELASIRARIEVMQKDLEDKRAAFDTIIREANEIVAKTASQVQETFGEYAREFLLEDCRLVWSPRPARLGQTGRRFDFPAFQLELGGSNFTGTVRRGEPGDVSESQREFIDISFRMALVNIATQQRTTSLVMDAPESSLDAVFVGRAARILGAFGHQEAGNRLVLTMNLVAGELIPSLLSEAASESDLGDRVVDLLALAAPTAALRDLRGEYDKAKELLLKQSDPSE